MTRARKTGERSVAIFLLALLVFSPPILSIFSAEYFVLGIPLLYLYLFTAWGVIIALLAWSADLGADDEPGARATPARAARRGAS